jgi:hypothetical protein
MPFDPLKPPDPFGPPNPFGGPEPFKPFRPLNDGWGIQPIGPSPLGGDIHDTFKIDPAGNISGGHTTIRIPGGKGTKLDW